jgi:DNA-binding winged helix-turn-helix (wHTH) protein/Tol biopolymer transport system component
MPSERVQLGQFVLDVSRYELTRAGEAVHMERIPMDLLMLLVRAGERLVSREEIIERLWGKDVYFDTDNSINSAIRKIRRALSDDPEKPQYIETVQGKGYRLKIPVEWVRDNGDKSSLPNANGHAAANEIGVVAPVQSKSVLLRKWVAVALVSATVIGGLLWALWRYPSRHTGNIERRLTTNSWENPVTGAAISPDGRFLVYSDSTGLYQKLIGTGETHSVLLPQDFSARMDNWFPDGAHVLVTRVQRLKKASLWSIPVFGGAPRKLTDDGSRASVSPDGSHIAFLRDTSSEHPFGSEVWVMRSDGTEQVKVAPAPAEVADSWLGAPVWSADGRQIAYIRNMWSQRSDSSSLELNEWQVAQRQIAFSDVGLGPALHWLSDGRLLYVRAEDESPRSDSGAWAITVLSGKIKGPPSRITRGPGSITTITASADGKLLALLRKSWQYDVYLGTLTGDGKQLLSSKRITLEENAAIPYSWTPDSRAILFASDRNGTFDIFKQAIDEPLAEGLVTGPDKETMPRLSSDDSEILYISAAKSSGPESLSSIFAIPIHGGAPRLVLKDAGIWTIKCARPPSTVCLYSIAQGKKMKTFRFDVRSGKTTDLNQLEPFNNWDLSPDGTERAIAVFDLDQGRIQLRSTSTGEMREILVKGWSGFIGIDWSPDGKSLFVVSLNYAGEATLLNIRLDGSASLLMSGDNPRLGFAIPSLDGRYLAIREQSGTSNVWMIENLGSNDQ